MGNSCNSWVIEGVVSDDNGPQPRSQEVPPTRTQTETLVIPTPSSSSEPDERSYAQLLRVKKLPEGHVLLGDTDQTKSIEMMAFFDETVRDFFNKNCPICLVDYEHGEAVLRSGTDKCRHMFHKKCISHWLAAGNNGCPCCREDYLVPELSVRAVGPTGVNGAVEYPA